MNKPLPQCGTPAGYSKHRRVGEVPCLNCRLAEAQRRDDQDKAAGRRMILAEALGTKQWKTPRDSQKGQR